MIHILFTYLSTANELFMLLNGAVVRPEHGIDQQPVVGRLLTPSPSFAVRPEHPERATAGQLRRVVALRILIPPPHQLQSGRLHPYSVNLTIGTHHLASFFFGGPN